MVPTRPGCGRAASIIHHYDRSLPHNGSLHGEDPRRFGDHRTHQGARHPDRRPTQAAPKSDRRARAPTQRTCPPRGRDPHTRHRRPPRSPTGLHAQEHRSSRGRRQTQERGCARPSANPSASLRAHRAGRTRPRSSRRSRTARRPHQRSPNRPASAPAPSARHSPRWQRPARSQKPNAATHSDRSEHSLTPDQAARQPRRGRAAALP